MKTYLVRNPETELGYELTTVDDNGIVEHHPEWVKELNKDNYFHLDTANPTGREWATLARLEKAGGQLELVPRGQTSTGEKSTSTPTKGWTEYLTDEEKALIEEIRTRALKRKKIADIKAQIEALQAQLPEEEDE